jgi:hypothetical protein
MYKINVGRISAKNYEKATLNKQKPHNKPRFIGYVKNQLSNCGILIGHRSSLLRRRHSQTLHLQASLTVSFTGEAEDEKNST